MSYAAESILDNVESATQNLSAAISSMDSAIANLPAEVPDSYRAELESLKSDMDDKLSAAYNLLEEFRAVFS